MNKIKIEADIICRGEYEFSYIPERNIWIVRLAGGRLFLGHGNALTDQHYANIINSLGDGLFKFLEEMIAEHKITGSCSLWEAGKSGLQFVKGDVAHETEVIILLLQQLVDSYK
jgi:hypothetical protein